MEFDNIYLGDCFTLIRGVPDASVDLIVTSPPYANRRSKTYGGVAADDYVNWFLPLATELWRSLKPSGSFILNIKENVVNGERHTYVINLIIALRSQGWRWVEEYIWHKKNSMPGLWPNRLRDAWERCLHFTKAPQFAMYHDAVKVPVAEATRKRAAAMGEADCYRIESSVGSGFGYKMQNCAQRDFALPSNVLHCATVTSNKSHSAAFPPALPTFFIKLFTQENDVVMDPFLGSGTTAVVANRLGRRYLGFEANPTYHECAERALANQQKLRRLASV